MASLARHRSPALALTRTSKADTYIDALTDVGHWVPALRMLGRLFLTLEMRPAARLGARSPIRQPPVPTSYLVEGQTSTIPLQALATVHWGGWGRWAEWALFLIPPPPLAGRRVPILRRDPAVAVDVDRCAPVT